MIFNIFKLQSKNCLIKNLKKQNNYVNLVNMFLKNNAHVQY